MKRVKIYFIILTVLISINLVSCGLFIPERGTFYGGKILDNKAMEELREEFNESVSNSTQNEIETTNDTQILTESAQNSEITHAESNDLEKSEIVFWSKSGSVWHLYSDCGHLKNSTDIHSGTIKEAQANGAKKVCSSCSKKAGN